MTVNLYLADELDELSLMACLCLTPVEKMQLARELSDTVKRLSLIQAIDTTGVEPYVYPAALPVLPL